MGVTVSLSVKFARFADLIGLSVMLPSLVIYYVSYLSDEFEMDEKSRNVQVQTVFLLMTVVTHFTAVDYVCHMVQRQIFFWACLGMMILVRYSHKENNIYSGFSISLVIDLLFEAVLYTNYRAKATLFMRIKEKAL